MVNISSFQLADLLQVSYRKAYRWGHYLNLPKTILHHRLTYHLPDQHPLIQSISCLRGSAKPVYTLSQIADLWYWSRGSYSSERIRQLFQKYEIPIYNQHGIGLVYLIDLQKCLKEP